MSLFSARISCACQRRRRVCVWHAGAFYARILDPIYSTCTVTKIYPGRNLVQCKSCFKISLNPAEKSTVLCSSRKYPYSPHRRDWNFLGCGGSVRPKNLKKCMKLYRNFHRGRGVLEKIPSVGEVLIFSGITHCNISQTINETGVNIAGCSRVTHKSEELKI